MTRRTAPIPGMLKNRSIVHNTPKRLDEDPIKTGVPSQAYRDGHDELFHRGDHINAACCECQSCIARRIVSKGVDDYLSLLGRLADFPMVREAK